MAILDRLPSRRLRAELEQLKQVQQTQIAALEQKQEAEAKRSRQALRRLKASREANKALMQSMHAMSGDLQKAVFGQTGSMGQRARTMSDLTYRVTTPGVPGVWTDNRIEQTRHFKRWVYVAIRAIANTIADEHPCCAVVRDGRDTELRSKQNKSRLLNRLQRAKAMTNLAQHEELEPLDSDHPLVELFANPNEDDTARDLWYETVLFLLLTGSAYWWLPRNGAGLPSEIWCLPSHWVWAIPGRDRMVDAYEVRPVEGGYMNWAFDADDIIHFKFKSPISKLDGWSPQTAGAQWIDISESIDTSRWHQFKEGSRPGVILELPETTDDPTDADITRIEAKFLMKMQGERKHGKPIILSPGVKATPWTMTPIEMDYVQSENQVRDIALGLFGVPKTIAGVTEDVNYSNIWGSLFVFHTTCLRPILHQIDGKATMSLAKRYDDKIRIYHEDKSPPDPDMALREWTAAQAGSAIAPNDWRRKLALEPFPNPAAEDPVAPVGSAPYPLSRLDEPLDLTALENVPKPDNNREDQRPDEEPVNRVAGFSRNGTH